MKIIEHRALRGPNRYSLHPTIFMLLDIGDYEDKPSDQIPGLPDRLVKTMPTLHSHRCSVGEPGGFIQRLNRGTWAGHIVEHLALELQCLAGTEVGFGKTFETPERGVYRVVYRYKVESVGLRAGRDAVAMYEAIANKKTFDMDAAVTNLVELRESDLLGPSTASIVNEALSRGIQIQRLNSNSLVQLGYGSKQRRIQATMTDRTSGLGIEIADEKFWTKQLLGDAGIAVPKGDVVRTLEGALEVAEDIGYPVAVKPEVGNHGKGITAYVAGPDELKTAFVSALRICKYIIVEKTLIGMDFRVLVINGKLEAAALREPAFIIGNGKMTIHQLIDQVNSDPRRGIGHEKVLTEITIDHMTERLLAFKGYKLADVLANKEKLYIKSTANLSTGGTARDVTDEVHQEVRLMCERIARIVGLDCIGVDIVAPSLDQPLEHGTAGVVEVNAAPGFRMHLDPSEGKPRNVAIPFVDMMFPSDVSFDFPIVAVTGTNGKTTTTKLIAHALKYSGHMVGVAGTTGVEIDGVPIISGDYSGPAGAGFVLREPIVDCAVLEVARGGLIRRGLGFDRCRVGVFLNVDADHIGVDGVEDIEDLALVKSTVIEVVSDRGTSVLNADDPVVAGLADRAGGKLLYFSMNPENKVVKKHLKAGGTAMVYEDGDIVLYSPEPTVHILAAAEAPITMGGVVEFNIANVLAAAAALHSLGIPVDMIKNGLSTFHSSATQNPGRMNMVDFITFKVLIDYGHNAPAIKAMGPVLGHLTKGRKIVVAHGSGNRLDQHLKQFGAALAGVYDRIILADIDPRGRKLGEAPRVVRDGILETGFAKENVEIIGDLEGSIARAFEMVQPGDLIVAQVDDIEITNQLIMDHFERIHGEGA